MVESKLYSRMKKPKNLHNTNSKQQRPFTRRIKLSPANQHPWCYWWEYKCPPHSKYRSHHLGGSKKLFPQQHNQKEHVSRHLELRRLYIIFHHVVFETSVRSRSGEHGNRDGTLLCRCRVGEESSKKVRSAALELTTLKKHFKIIYPTISIILTRLPALKARRIRWLWQTNIL